MADQLNIIACEGCRSKKCKCDRHLPSCSQCEAARVTCRYPQGSKRGIPTGYIATLEKRLLETEVALLREMLAKEGSTRLMPSNVELSRIFLEHDNHLSKSERVVEWTHLPLYSQDQRDQWLAEKLEKVDEHVDTISNASPSLMQHHTMSTQPGQQQIGDDQGAAMTTIPQQTIPEHGMYTTLSMSPAEEQSQHFRRQLGFGHVQSAQRLNSECDQDPTAHISNRQPPQSFESNQRYEALAGSRNPGKAERTSKEYSRTYF